MFRHRFTYEETKIISVQQKQSVTEMFSAKRIRARTWSNGRVIWWRSILILTGMVTAFHRSWKNKTFSFDHLVFLFLIRKNWGSSNSLNYSKKFATGKTAKSLIVQELLFRFASKVVIKWVRIKHKYYCIQSSTINSVSNELMNDAEKFLFFSFTY